MVFSGIWHLATSHKQTDFASLCSLAPQKSTIITCNLFFFLHPSLPPINGCLFFPLSFPSPSLLPKKTQLTCNFFVFPLPPSLKRLALLSSILPHSHPLKTNLPLFLLLSPPDNEQLARSGTNCLENLALAVGHTVSHHTWDKMVQCMRGIFIASVPHQVLLLNLMSCDCHLMVM